MKPWSTSAPLVLPRPRWRIDATTWPASSSTSKQLEGEIVEGVIALIHPLEQSLGATIGLDGGHDYDVWGGQRLDGPAIARVDRRVDARRELASLGHRAKAIGVGGAHTVAFASEGWATAL